jgi:hypothetical protein
MSLIGKRAEIANALTGAGFHGYEKRPVEPVEGDCWPSIPSLIRDAGDAFIVTWQVRVVTPQDEQAALDWWDIHWPTLYYALKPVLFVTGAAPIVLATAAGDLLAYAINGTVEE